MTTQHPPIVVAAPPISHVASFILQLSSLQDNPRQARLLVGKVERQINGYRHKWSLVEGAIRVIKHETVHNIEVTEHESVGGAARRVMEATTGIDQPQFLVSLKEPLRMASGHGGNDLGVEVPFYLTNLSAEDLRLGTGDMPDGLQFGACEFVGLRTFHARINTNATPERIPFHNRLAACAGHVLACVADCYKKERLSNPLNDLPHLVQARLGADFTGDEFRPAWELYHPTAPAAPPTARRLSSVAPAP